MQLLFSGLIYDFNKATVTSESIKKAKLKFEILASCLGVVGSQARVWMCVSLKIAVSKIF